MPSENVKWTPQHTLAAFHLYTLLPFGKLHSKTPEIQQLASWEGRTPSSLAMKLVNFASLDPQINASGRAGLSGASNQDRMLWSTLQGNWDSVAQQAAEAYSNLATMHGVNADGPLLDEDVEPMLQEGRTRSATVQIRVNQTRFRKAVLTSYNETCCMSGLQLKSLLIASHIVPWSVDTKNRLNPQNGLCLSALHDRAFDQGLITVMPDYTIRISTVLLTQKSEFAQQSFLQLNNKKITLPEKLRPDPIFLSHHAKKFGFL